MLRYIQLSLIDTMNEHLTRLCLLADPTTADKSLRPNFSTCCYMLRGVINLYLLDITTIVSLQPSWLHSFWSNRSSLLPRISFISFLAHLSFTEWQIHQKVSYPMLRLCFEPMGMKRFMSWKPRVRNRVGHTAGHDHVTSLNQSEAFNAPLRALLLVSRPIPCLAFHF